MSFLAGLPAAAQQAPTRSDATASIHGIVTNKQDNAVSGVSGVSVKLAAVPAAGNPLSADTDETGKYEFKGLKPGTYTLSVTLAGFKTLRSRSR